MIDFAEQRRATRPLQRRLVLELLNNLDRVPPEHIPPIWPLRPSDVSDEVAALERTGAVVYRWDVAVPGRQVIRLAEAGARMLASLDDNAMRAEMRAAAAEHAALV